MSTTPKLSEIVPNIRQEVGVMVGFMAIFALSITTYGIIWNLKNKRQARKEEERQRELIERGFGPREKRADGSFEQGLGHMGGAGAMRGEGGKQFVKEKDGRGEVATGGITA